MQSNQPSNYQPQPEQQPQSGPGAYQQRPPAGPPRKSGGAKFGCLLLFCMLGGLCFVGIAMLMLVGIGDLSSSPTPLRESHVMYESTADAKVAILTIDGVITESTNGFVKKQINRILEDEDVKGVVLRVNSPGGTISGSDYYLHYLNEMKTERDIPIVVSMGPIAASGGYYVAMCGDRIFAEPATFTGSIGVIIPLYNGAQLCEKIGIEDDAVTSHRLKGMGSFLRPMTEEEREIWQALVDEGFEMFKEVVREGRPEFRMNPEKLDAIATGQVFTGKQALENGLVDELGYIEDAVDHVIEKAGLSEDSVNVIRYKQEITLSMLLSGQARAQQQPVIDVKMLMNATTPQPYFLCPRALPIIPNGE